MDTQGKDTNIPNVKILLQKNFLEELQRFKKDVYIHLGKLKMGIFLLKVK